MLHREKIYERYVSAGPTAAIADDMPLRAAYLRSLIRRYFPADKTARILDLGCGRGTLLHMCREAGYPHLKGVDISSEQVELAARGGLDCVEKADLLAYLRSTPPGSYDVVTAFDVIEHFTKPEIMQCLEHILRALKPGGRLIVHVPNGESPFFGAVFYGDFTHEWAFTRQSIAQLAITCGYSLISCYEDPIVPHGPASTARWIAWKLIRLVLRFIVAAETGNTSSDIILSRNLLAALVK